MNLVKTAGSWLLAFLSLCLAAGCANAQPTRWTLWYVPNQPKPGVVLRKPCHTYVFATPTQTEYVVAVIKGWSDPSAPQGPDAVMYTGEDFSGSLALGPQTIHDVSNGHDLNVDAVYRVRAYTPAKLRADTACGITEQTIAPTPSNYSHPKARSTTR